MEDLFWKRINYKGTLKEISEIICRDYDLGEFILSNLVLVGYEDFNFFLKTTNGKYFVKIFASFRTLEDCKRYIKIVEAAIKSGVSTPKLLKSNQSDFHIIELESNKLRLCVMDYIEGDNLYNLNKSLNNEEVRFLAGQAALINSIDIKPYLIYDPWAITNFLKEFEQKSGYFSSEDLQLVKPLVKDFKKLQINKLPQSFVHGDIIVTNVLKDKNNKLWIIDFSVSNVYPRIQELAVLACNLLFNSKDKYASEKNLEIALEEYQKTIKLTSQELSSLQTYIKLAHAMHVLSANYEKVSKKNISKENEYWLQQGRLGIKQMMLTKN